MASKQQGEKYPDCEYRQKGHDLPGNPVMGCLIHKNVCYPSDKCLGVLGK